MSALHFRAYAPKIDHAALLALVDAGHSADAIARQLDCQPKTVQKIARDHGRLISALAAQSAAAATTFDARRAIVTGRGTTFAERALCARSAAGGGPCGGVLRHEVPITGYGIVHEECPRCGVRRVLTPVRRPAVGVAA